MNKIIATTTINPPTEALVKYASLSDWAMVIAGDIKTPHSLYKTMKNVIYLAPEDQEKMSKELSDAIGWNSIQRRNFAFIKAYQMGADILATVDDDNIPYDFWGQNLLVGKDVEIDLYHTNQPVFDPLFITKHKNLWHRGFPVSLVADRSINKKQVKKVKCYVQADLWNGDPDVDAICRITQKPQVKFDRIKPFSSSVITPFNSQNTFISRELLPYYMVIPHVGRMDDIWGGYIMQIDNPMKSLPLVVFNRPSVYQARNEHDLIKDLENEILGYRSTMDLILQGYRTVLPAKSVLAFDIYRGLFNK